MFKRILLAYDGSDSADHAFDYARVLSKRFGASIDVIWVTRTPRIAGDIELTALLEEGARRANHAQQHLQYRGGDQCTDLRFHQEVTSRPAVKIVARADELGSELIVMGYRPMSILGRMLDGSTTHQVIEHAHRPVLMVP
jgi:nucleotide-binding universal stress UspA family protein